MFKIVKHTHYFGEKDHGHIKVFMNTGTHGTIIDCTYEKEGDELHFKYEKNHCLSCEEIEAFEEWFKAYMAERI